MSTIRRNYPYLYLLPLVLVLLALLNPAHAADEDMVSQVYLEFDPETGEFKTAQDPSLSGTSRHQQAQSKQIEQIQQRQESRGSTAQTTAAAPRGEAGAGSPAGGAAAPGSALWAGGIIVLGLVVGAVILVRKNQHKAAS